MCGLGMTADSMPIITSFWSWMSSIMSVCRCASTNLMSADLLRLCGKGGWQLAFSRSGWATSMQGSHGGGALARTEGPERERGQADGHAERAHTVPAPALVHEGGHGGTGGRAHKARRHVERVDAAARLRLQPVDLALVGDVHAVRPDIEHHHTGEQRDQRRAAHPQQHVAHEQE